MGRIIILAMTSLALVAYSMTALWIGINDITMINAIERQPLIFSPAGFVYLFSIILSIGLIGYVWQAYQQRRTIFIMTKLQVFLFVSASAFQIAFFHMWHYEHYIASLILLALQLLSLFSLHLTYPLHRENILLRIPIAMWLGWNLFFAFIIGSYVLLYFDWDRWGLSNALWTVILLTAGAAIALHLRYHHFDRIAPAIFLFGYIGIIVTNGFDELFVSAAAFFLCGVMVFGIVFMEKKRRPASS
ncbi:MAG: hypothetical protein ACI33P_12380 [Lysinibacillus sp.]